MPPWNLQETRDQVERRYGNAQLQVISKCLESIVDRQRYAGYHFHEHQRLLSAHIDDRLVSKSIYEITLALEPKEEGELDLCLTQVSANIVACIQSMHSLADILAHVVYFALGLNNGANKLKEQNISIGSVADLLRKMPEFGELTKILEGISTHPDFVYLNALVNHCKHRSIVGTVLSVDPPTDGKPPYALLFDEFTYREIPYARRDINPFLEPTYAWLSQEVVNCGNALNQLLEK